MSARSKPPTEEQRTAVFEPRRDPPAIQVISMKPPAPEKRAVPEHVVRIRAISEVSRHDTPTNLGRLAPPRDPIGARKRQLRDVVIWGFAVLVVAVGVMLGVWFLAR